MLEVAEDNCTVALLTRWIPELEIESLTLSLDLFRAVVEADCGDLRVEDVVDVAHEEGRLAHGWVPDHDYFEADCWVFLFGHRVGDDIYCWFGWNK